MCDKENCNCGSNPCCGDCEPWNCVEQAVNDVWATKEGQIEGLVDRAETAAENSEASAKASAESAAEAKEFRDEAETAATTAVAAEGVVLGVAGTLEDTANKLKQIADELGTAIAGISVVTWYYTTVQDNQKVIPVPSERNEVDVQAIYIEGARQEPNRGFNYDKLNREITLAEPLPLGMEIPIIIGTYSDNPNDFANTLASNNGASLVGTSRGITVQQTINELDRSFQDGGVLRSSNDTLLDKSTNPYQEYVWTGDSSTFPKVVPPGSTPLSTGGVAQGAWVSVGDASLRGNLSAVNGASIIGGGTYAAIRAFAGEGNKINCIGRENIFDGGSGVFYLDTNDTTSADNDGTILVDAAGRRWKRDFSGDISPLWFGVKFDGVTACHAEWQKCIDAADGEWINIGSHAGYSVISAPLVVRPHMKLRGVNSSYNGAPNSWIHGAHTGNIFELSETTRGMRIEGVYFSGQGCTALNSNSFYWADTILKDCSFDLSLNYGMKGQFIEVYTDKCQFGVGALGVPAHTNWTPVFGTWTSSPFQMSNVCTFNRCRFEHSKSPFGALIWAGAYLLNLQSCIFQYNTGANTVVLTQGVTNVDFDSCYFEANSGNSFLWDANLEGTGTRAYGRYKFTNNYADTRNQALSAVVSTYDQPVEMRRNYIFGNSADYYLTRNSNGGAFESNTISSASDNYLVGGYVGKYNRNQHVIAGGGAGRATLNAPIATTPVGVTSMQIVGVSNTTGSAIQMHNSNSINGTDYQPTGKIQFCNGGTIQHHIVGYTNRELVFGLNGTDYAQLSTTYLAPWTDNQISAGTSSKRFTQIYAATSTISTSDETKKSEFFDVTEAERNAALEIKSSIRKFKKLDAVEKKGFDGARWHFGVGAQTVGDIMRKHGLDPDKYGFWCHDVWEAQPEQTQVWEAEYDSEGNEIKPAVRHVIKEAEEGGEIYGIRYEELAMFILASI